MEERWNKKSRAKGDNKEIVNKCKDEREGEGVKREDKRA